MRALALAKLLLALATVPADAQILRGRVVDGDTERGLAAVSLALIDDDGETPLSTITDEQGRFRLVPRGGARFALRVERPGYSGFIVEDLVVARGEEVALEVRLATDRIVLSPMMVVGRRRTGDVGEFESRLRLMRQAGIGQSLVRAEIETRDVLEITDLLATLPDIIIAGPPRGRTVRFATGSGTGTCAPSIFVNARRLEPTMLDLVGTPAVIDAVELYSGVVESPPEFEDPAGCGVVLVWTRPDPADAGPVKWRRAVVYIGMTVVGVVLFSR